MIYLPEKEFITNRFIKYADFCFEEINRIYGKIDNNIFTKKPHSLAMAKSVSETTIESNIFNETYASSAYIEGLLHDIGRFKQYIIYNTLDDVILNKNSGIHDHGNFGRIILSENNKSLLRYFLPQESAYDNVLLDVVGEHTTVRNKNYIYPITDLIHLFQDTDFEKLVESDNQELKNKLIALKLLILQEIDSLDLLRNVASGLFKPGVYMSSQHMSVEGPVWDDFLNFRRIDLAKYKASGDWRRNFGVAFRYGLLTRVVNFVSVLKQFVDSGYFEQIWTSTEVNCFDKVDGVHTEISDPMLYEAQEYIQIAVNNLIATSPDGIIITPESREEARKLSLSMWKDKGHKIS